MPKAPSVKQEPHPSSSPYKTPPPRQTSSTSTSSSPVKQDPSSSPTKANKASPKKDNAPISPPVDENVGKKLKIMGMIFDAAKGLKAEDIAAEVGMTTLQVRNLL